jgi:hypothetical protein
MTGSRLLLQPIPTIERTLGGVTIRAPDYSQPGVAERVEAEQRAYERAQITPTLAELVEFNARWRR